MLTEVTERRSTRSFLIGALPASHLCAHRVRPAGRLHLDLGPQLGLPEARPETKETGTTALDPAPLLQGCKTAPIPCRALRVPEPWRSRRVWRPRGVSSG